MKFHYTFNRALPDITEYFNSYSTSIMRFSEVSKIFHNNKALWNLPESTTVRQFIAFVLEKSQFTRVELGFPARKEILYSWGPPSITQVAMSIKPAAYFSHYSAMSFHNLTDRIPKTFYLNSEQHPKYYIDRKLEQQRIDIAFKKKPRSSKNIASFGEYRICLLNGMYTGGLGVIELTTQERDHILVTDVERTLIDIAVRPFYSGGVFEVLEAFRRASDAAKMEKLAEMLRLLDYIYPYHQAIGFYIERSGCYSRHDIELFKTFDFDFDFHLTHQIKDPEYSAQWRLFFPKGL